MGAEFQLRGGHINVSRGKLYEINRVILISREMTARGMVEKNKIKSIRKAGEAGKGVSAYGHKGVQPLRQWEIE